MVEIPPKPVIEWRERVVALAELEPFEHNPRTITEAQYEKLKDSLKKTGYRNRICVTIDLKVIGGHQRLRALKELGFVVVPVLIADRVLTKEEFEYALLSDNHHNGVFNMDMIANMFDLEFLRDIGLHEVEKIPPMDHDDAPKPAKKFVLCPCGCNHTFAIKGNMAEVAT